MILAEIAEVPVKLVPKDTLEQQIKMDLIAALEREHCEPVEDLQDNSGMRPLKKMRKSTLEKQENLSSLTKQVLFMLQNRIPAMRVSGTLSSAAKLLESLKINTDNSSPMRH